MFSKCIMTHILSKLTLLLCKHSGCVEKYANPLPDNIVTTWKVREVEKMLSS